MPPEEYFSFVNGQHTTMGGTHLTAFREALADTIRNFFKKDYDAADIRQSIDAARKGQLALRPGVAGR